MIDLKKYERSSGLAPSVLKSLYKDAIDTAKAIYGHDRNEQFIIDTFEDLIKAFSYQESVDSKIDVYLENEEKEVDSLV